MMSKWFRKAILSLQPYSTEISLGTVMVLVLILGIYITQVNFNIQIKAFQTLMKQQEFIDENVSYAGLIVKYARQQKLYQGLSDQQKEDREVFRYKHAIFGRNTIESSVDKVSVLDGFFIFLLNQVKKITGNSPILVVQDDGKNILTLYNAYFLENSKNYLAAMRIYDAFLKSDPESSIRANIQLHRGYCFALMEDYSNARNSYREVMAENPGSGIAVSAGILLQYMELFIAEKQKILDSSIDGLKKGEKLTMLLNNKAALEVLEGYQPKNNTEKSKVEYYKGVAWEELGDKRKAIASYTGSIEADQNSAVAKSANRKIYSIAADLPDNHEMLDASLDIGKKQNDTYLVDLDRKYRGDIEKTGGMANKNEEKELLITALQTLENGITARLSKPTIPAASNVKFVIAAVKAEDPVVNAGGVGMRVKIITVSNESISGVLRNSSNADPIILETLLGEVAIKKKNIQSLIPVGK